MFKKALILGAFAAILGIVAAEKTKTTKKETKKKTKPTETESAKAKKKSDDINPVLRPIDNGKYKILQLTDLHLGEDLEADKLTYNLLSGAISTEQPNIVVITGDLISGSFMGRYGAYSDFYKQLTDWFSHHSQAFAWIPGPADWEAIGPHLDAGVFKNSAA
jgi:hypothetical protein